MAEKVASENQELSGHVGSSTGPLTTLHSALSCFPCVLTVQFSPSVGLFLNEWF